MKIVHAELLVPQCIEKLFFKELLQLRPCLKYKIVLRGLAGSWGNKIETKWNKLPLIIQNQLLSSLLQAKLLKVQKAFLLYAAYKAGTFILIEGRATWVC